MSANKRPPARGWRSRKVQILGVGVVVVAVASGTLAWSLTGSGHSNSAPVGQPDPTPTGTPGDQWAAAVGKDFGGLSTVVVGFLTSLRDWRADKADDTQMAAAAKSMLDDVADTQHALAVRQPFAQAPLSLTDYRASADLYAQAAFLARTTTAVPRGDLRTQLQLAISRVQTLADRIYDQGAAEIKPYTTPDRDFDSVQITRADEIPSFGASSLAAGPPLTAVGAVATPHPYQTTRPSEPLADWVHTVEGAKIPPDKDTETAIDSGTVSSLRADSIAFSNASELLHDTADPQGERAVSTRLQLALLLDAESTQMGQAATLVPAAQHDEILHSAQALSLIADRLWDDRVGARASAYPESLLNINSS